VKPWVILADRTDLSKVTGATLPVGARASTLASTREWPCCTARLNRDALVLALNMIK